MSATATLEVSQFRPEEKQLIEQLLGEVIAPGERVMIMKFTPNAIPDEETRRAARASINRTLDAAHGRAVALGITAEEVEAAMDEAMDEIRHGRR